MTSGTEKPKSVKKYRVTEDIHFDLNYRNPLNLKSVSLYKGDVIKIGEPRIGYRGFTFVSGRGMTEIAGILREKRMKEYHSRISLYTKIIKEAPSGSVFTTFIRSIDKYVYFDVNINLIISGLTATDVIQVKGPEGFTLSRMKYYEDRLRKVSACAARAERSSQKVGHIMIYLRTGRNFASQFDKLSLEEYILLYQ